MKIVTEKREQKVYNDMAYVELDDPEISMIKKSIMQGPGIMTIHSIDVHYEIKYNAGTSGYGSIQYPLREPFKIVKNEE